MNQPQHNHDHLFDCLVDGELSQAQYQALLAALDDEPGGWRRCALSFLEGQALEQELGSLRRERVEAPPTAPPAANVSRAGVRIGAPWIALAMVASFLVAFGLGLAIRRDSSPSATGAPAPQVAENDPPPAAVPTALPNRNNSALAKDDARGNQPLGNVTLVVDGNAASPQQRVEVPVYSYDQVGQDYFASEHMALPPEVRDMLQRSGHELRRRQQLVPLQLENGQQAVFPMEEVEIVPVRMPAF
jgi:hypothetical protein